jgi:hypothetical protein
MQTLESIMDLSGHRVSSCCTFVTNDLRILGVPVGYKDFVTHFLDESLFHDMVHINDLPLL